MRRQPDQFFKKLLDQDPRGFLHLAGRLPLEAAADVRPLQREITREPMHIDAGFLVDDEDGPRVEHVEGFAQYKRDDADRVALYALDLVAAYRCPVFSTAVLLFERYDRADLPTVGRIDYGRLKAEYPVDLLRLWRIPGDALVELGRPGLIPWLPLLDVSPETCSAATRVLDATRHPDETGMFLFLGELRYGKDVWRQVLERGFRMIPEELLEQTSYYQKWTHRAQTLGLEQGLERGQLAARRDIAKLLLQQRFPMLVTRAANIDACAKPAVLDRFILHLSQAADPEAAGRLLDELAE